MLQAPETLPQNRIEFIQLCFIDHCGIRQFVGEVAHQVERENAVKASPANIACIIFQPLPSPNPADFAQSSSFSSELSPVSLASIPTRGQSRDDPSHRQRMGASLGLSRHRAARDHRYPADRGDLRDLVKASWGRITVCLKRPGVPLDSVF